ncbi:hypothetical protein BDF19DRAFT_438123, partial [Syncephalis fuscata]
HHLLFQILMISIISIHCLLAIYNTSLILMLFNGSMLISDVDKLIIILCRVDSKRRYASCQLMNTLKRDYLT